MTQLIDLYKIYRKNSAPVHFMLLQFSSLKPKQKIFYVFSWFLVVAIIPVIIGINCTAHSEKFFECFNVAAFVIFIFFVVGLQTSQRRAAFSELYQSHEKEIKFAQRENDYIQYLLLKNTMIKDNTYNSKFINTVLQSLKIELRDGEPDSVFKNPFVIVMIPLAINFCLDISRLVESKASYTNTLRSGAAWLMISLGWFMLLIWAGNCRKKRLLCLEKYLKMMLLEIKRKKQSVTLHSKQIEKHNQIRKGMVEDFEEDHPARMPQKICQLR